LQYTDNEYAEITSTNSVNKKFKTPRRSLIFKGL
jgi:hypothetical protein